MSSPHRCAAACSFPRGPTPYPKILSLHAPHLHTVANYYAHHRHYRKGLRVTFPAQFRVSKYVYKAINFSVPHQSTNQMVRWPRLVTSSSLVSNLSNKQLVGYGARLRTLKSFSPVLQRLLPCITTSWSRKWRGCKFSIQQTRMCSKHGSDSCHSRVPLSSAFVCFADIPGVLFLLFLRLLG
jgi:hypothetical protein